MATLSRINLFVVAAIVVLALSPSVTAYSSKLLTLDVYADGYVHVGQTFMVDSKATTVVVPLLTSVVSDLVATDQNGSPLSYSFASGGSNVTIYTLGATVVNLRYDTATLTAKNGSIWTLTFTSRFNSTVVFPQLSTITSVSGAPYSITENGTSPMLLVSAGAWKVSYGVPLSMSTSTNTSTFTGSGGGPIGGSGGLGLLQVGEVGVAVAAVALAGLSYRWRRRMIGPKKGELRPDDVQVLNFIQEKGGKVLEPEIRTRFALPKTSAWRQIKRLERLGYVKVTKIGSQNQIELIGDRRAGG